MGPKIKKVMLVSRNLESYSFSAQLKTILKLADEHRVDTVLFALFTVHVGDGFWRLTNRHCFQRSQHVQRVILETANLDGHAGKETNLRMEWWTRGKKKPAFIFRQFAKGSDSREMKLAFMHQFNNRIFGEAFAINCGEVNIVSVEKKKHRFAGVSDEFGFLPRLKKAGTQIIFQPSHTRMVRWELSAKKKYLSLDGRTVISVWNDWLRHSSVPWSVFRSGRDCTDRVKEIPKPIESRPDIRIGILELK